MQSTGATTGAISGLNEGELRLLRARIEHVSQGPFELSQPFALWQIHRLRAEMQDGVKHPLDEVATFGQSEDANFFLDAQRLLPRLLADYERLCVAERGELPKGA
jgi:hypothetical protein